jgi:hypothetical protein
MKKIILPAVAASLMVGASAAGYTSQSNDVALAPTAPPVASNTSADYQHLLARTGGIVSALTHIIIPPSVVDSSTFDK